MEESRKQSQRKYYLAHKEEIDDYHRKYLREWRKRNPEKYKKIQERYFQKNPYLKISPARRYRIILINSLGNKCSKCGSTERLEIHHKISKQDKFNTTIDDCLLLCMRCHRIKIHKLKFDNL